ncbi:hypothetical protein RVN83_36410 [Streptomyces sp. PU10]|uniref:hypothetical protein n=1 Tax=unclassified Streptomyces TaxID=2593676 RepID=UPI0028FC68E9|nr:hypothetical protein [Streptomyces sp. PU10]MDU0258412.1 hypothetical protein [Streptomyces sp. PU10]
MSLLAVLAGTLVVSASPAAQADGDYCGHRVLGDIERRYLAMGGPEGSLGCPLTEELVNHDGIGHRTQCPVSSSLDRSPLKLDHCTVRAIEP